LQDAYTELKKVQNQQIAALKENEDLMATRTKALADYKTKEATLSKIESKLASAEEKAELTKFQLKQQDDVCRGLQAAHYTKHMPSVLMVSLPPDSTRSFFSSHRFPITLNSLAISVHRVWRRMNFGAVRLSRRV
jgi:hypothetical protein